MLVRQVNVGWLAAALMYWQCSHAPTDLMLLSSPLPKLQEETNRQTEPDPEEPIEWILVEDLPERVPVPMLLPLGSQERAASQSHQGVLVMYHWVIDGEPVSSEREPPFLWPSPQSIAGDSVVIDLGTSIAPIEVETRIFRSVDERGLPQTPSPAIWCRYLSSSAECKITRDSDEETWKVILKLPDRGTFYISFRGTWGFPINPDESEETAISDVDAAWLFAVNNDCVFVSTSC